MVKETTQMIAMIIKL